MPTLAVVRSKVIYLALGVQSDGTRDILIAVTDSTHAKMQVNARTGTSVKDALKRNLRQ
jgi:transposase-like protein